MKVFKFGGASVNSPERIRNLAAILRGFEGQQILVIVSAMGKTTNALEQIAAAFFEGHQEKALQLFAALKKEHIEIMEALGGNASMLEPFFTEAEWQLHDKAVRGYDYYYDQIVCTGELLSTTIISDFLNRSSLQNSWFDARDVIRTDNNFRDAAIDWPYTEMKVNTVVKPLFQSASLAITQGFIGATDENESTTLGREGSDFTAAVFANLLNAESQTIWKDVKGVMNADPKQIPDAVLIPELNYLEVIEMAYYGAQVIHPKTIKPLQNKQIPLYVKSFLDPSLPGTAIHGNAVKGLPPIIVLKNEQVLVTLRTLDYSFVGEHHVTLLYQMLEKWKIKPTLTQNAAISFICLIDNKPGRVEQLAGEAAGIFEVQVRSGLSLLTIRHFSEEVLNHYLQGRKTVLRQQTEETVQIAFEAKRESGKRGAESEERSATSVRNP